MRWLVLFFGPTKCRQLILKRRLTTEAQRHGDGKNETHEFQISNFRFQKTAGRDGFGPCLEIGNEKIKNLGFPFRPDCWRFQSDPLPNCFVIDPIQSRSVFFVNPKFEIRNSKSEFPPLRRLRAFVPLWLVFLFQQIADTHPQDVLSLESLC